jgi:hypothetical protein
VSASLGVKLCEALGLNPLTTAKIPLTINTDEIMKATVLSYVLNEQEDHLVEIVRGYKLVKDEPIETPTD